ncbi:MAG TPA: AAA family ATPase [Longimicrobium sp.]|nr:AAA family ATPase [Longimicrobium sp.]
MRDVKITYRYYDGEREFRRDLRKGSAAWQGYRSRPNREVEILPLSRMLPAHEVRAIRMTFGRPDPVVNNTPLGGVWLERLSYVMDRNYTSADFQEKRRLTFRRCTAGMSYTAFNMGGGESCMITLFHLLARMPVGGLLVGEEIEGGLHPEAQIRLAETLVDVCDEKKMQIVCSTHSADFLDALPREARILLRRTRETLDALSGPSTRFALYVMSGSTQPEVMLYCEDDAAVALVSASLPHSSLVRVRVRPIGSNHTVIRQGVAHIRGEMPAQGLCILDGDCTESLVENWIRSEDVERDNAHPRYLILPGGGLAPERWVIQQLAEEEYRHEFARQFQCSSSEALSHVQALDVVNNHHRLGRVLARRTGLDEADCLRRTMFAVAPRHPQLEPLRSEVAEILDALPRRAQG